MSARKRSEPEVLASAKCKGLMQVIGRIIDKHYLGESHLDQKTFKLYEIAKCINQAESNKDFLAAIDRLKQI